MVFRLLKRLLRLLLILYAGALIVAFVIEPAPLPEHPFFSRGTSAPLVIAHRGGPELGPESTLYTYRKVADLGVDMLEMDVHATRNGRLVVAHDRRVNRVTNGTGRIAEMTFDELRSLDAGYNWTVDSLTYPLRGKGIQMPTVEEMFDTFPDWRFVIELKARTPAVAQDLCAAVEQHGLTERVAIASFSGDALKSFRTACPQVLTTASFDEGLLFWVLHKLRLDDLYTPTPFGGFMVMPQLGPFTTIDERLMQTARRRNLAVQVWTINERAQMEKFIRLGVNGIMTDRPTQLLSLIEGGSTQ